MSASRLDVPTIGDIPREDTMRVLVIAAPGRCRRYFTGLYLRGRELRRHFALDPEAEWVLRFEPCVGIGDELLNALRRDEPGSAVFYSSLATERRWFRGDA